MNESIKIIHFNVCEKGTKSLHLITYTVDYIFRNLGDSAKYKTRKKKNQKSDTSILIELIPPHMKHVRSLLNQMEFSLIPVDNNDTFYI